MSTKSNSHIRILCESAIMIALATVLSMIKIFEAPYGGSVTLLSMAPMIILSLRRGVSVGVPAAFVHALVQLLLGLSNVAYVPTPGGIVLCILFDYILAFTVLGLGGMFRKVRFTKNETTNLLLAAFLGTLVVTVLRFACHVVSGAVIWYALDLEWYAGNPAHLVYRYGAWMFSLIYNGSFMLPEILETCIGVPILARALKAINQ